MQSHFKFNKQERSGIFFLLLIIVLLQVGYLIFRSSSSYKSVSSFSSDTKEQAKIDAIKETAIVEDTVKIYPFNPNFISDYKGYTLGMSIAEIDRLHAFRSKNEYVNSAEDFLKVTQIPDSLLKVISPFFRFPEWTKRDRQPAVNGVQFSTGRNISSHSETLVEKFKIKDINSVTSEELQIVNGVGEVLSKRIVKFRNRLGGFIIDDQLIDVYGLEPFVAKRVLRKYKVLKKPTIERININTASVDAISSLVYIRYDVARSIVSYREENGPLTSLNELEYIEGFPTEKFNRIALYLSL